MPAPGDVQALPEHVGLVGTLHRVDRAGCGVQPLDAFSELIRCAEIRLRQHRGRNAEPGEVADMRVQHIADVMQA